MKAGNLSPLGSYSTRGNNKAIPRQMSEELKSLLNDNSLKLKQSELENLRRLEREELEFGSPQCPICDEGNLFLFKVSSSNCYCCSCG